MHRCESVWFAVSLTALLLASGLSADDHAEFRGAWKSRRAEQPDVQYRASAVKIVWAQSGQRRQESKAEMDLYALLKNEEAKFRFEAQNHDGTASVHVAAGREFHTCEQQNESVWEATSAKSIAEDSDWVYYYPFLLAHGVVPQPPFGVSNFASQSTPRQPLPERADVRNREATFDFRGDSRYAVSITHGNDGLISNYRVSKEGHRFVEIANSYEAKAGAPQLSRFSVMRFDAAGGLIARIDAKIEQYRTDVRLASHLFAPPRPLQDVRKQIQSSLTGNVQVAAITGLDQLESAIQKALAADVRVRIDEQAFAGRHEVSLDRMTFEPGQVSLSEFLFRDLRRNRLDFYFDSQGIVLIPRSRAWKRAELVQYSPGDYGLTAEELRELIYTAGEPDDWSDVGGVAQLGVNGEGQISVFHAQSDHVHFSRKLSEFAKKP